MPVVIWLEMFSEQVRGLETIGGFEFLNRILHASDSAKVMAVHMPRVRDVRGKTGVESALFERLADLSAVLKGVCQVVMGGEMMWNKLERVFIKRYGGRRAALSPIARSRSFGDAALQPNSTSPGNSTSAASSSFRYRVSFSLFCGASSAAN